MQKKGIIFIILFALIANIACTTEQHFDCSITRIIDGDTLDCKTNGHIKRIRLIGIDTPEMDTSRGMQARNYVRTLLHRGQTIQCETDKARLDPYNRTLAYVYLPNGVMLNNLLIEEEHARIMSIEPNTKHAKLLRNSFNNK